MFGFALRNARGAKQVRLSKEADFASAFYEISFFSKQKSIEITAQCTQ
jgi:hypothetical protein